MFNVRGPSNRAAGDQRSLWVRVDRRAATLSALASEIETRWAEEQVEGGANGGGGAPLRASVLLQKAASAARPPSHIGRASAST